MEDDWHLGLHRRPFFDLYNQRSQPKMPEDVMAGLTFRFFSDELSFQREEDRCRNMERSETLCKTLLVG